MALKAKQNTNDSALNEHEHACHRNFQSTHINEATLSHHFPIFINIIAHFVITFTTSSSHTLTTHCCSFPMAQHFSSVGFTYEVFLSFRGFDTRYNFTGNLYKALCDRGIHTFMDDTELQGGEEITPSLLKAIENSRIAIIVFSENYASSSFCLDELVHIIHDFKVNDRLVLPVFYGVEPTHLRYHTGSYGLAIAQHEKKLQNNIERLHKWKIALNQAANLSGHTFNPAGKEYEYEFIGKIVDLISNKINRTPLHVADFHVGLESRVLKMKSLLNMGSDDGVCMVGIHGIGGIGKTTLAREIYNSIANQFEVLCFLDDVRQKTHQHGLVHLQEILLHETIRDKDIKFGSVCKGISTIKQRLYTKKVLLILDDVDDLKQLEALAGGCDWFGPGSEVIITTRDLHLLKSHGIEKTYEVEELDEDEALELLMWKAFKNNNVDSSYDDILNRVVTYASGLPLALEVVGSNLCGKHIEEWDSTLARYKRGPHRKIQKILQVSFDTLEEDEQSVFLDIACCLRGHELLEIEDILHAHYGDCMKYHIGVLVEKSLVKISKWRWNDTNFVTLHDLIVDMGENIVLQESPKEPGKRSRLWLHKDIVPVLGDNTGTNKIEIMPLDCGTMDAVLDWNEKTFKKMRNLKTLIFYSGSGQKTHFSKGPGHFPSSLRVLVWIGYPFEFIPSIFLSKKFENMKILKFDYSIYLTDIPEVSGVPNLEIFSFRSCKNLITIHESVGFLSKLKILDVEGCSKLRSFPPIIKLLSLQVLRLSHTGLKSFPEISGEMKNITQFALEYTPIEKFPSSFQRLTGICNLTITISGDRLPLTIRILMMLNLSRVFIKGCRLLPLENDNSGSIAPSNVKVLHLKFCELSDEILPVVLKLVPNVEELDLCGSNFTILPECIKECRFLRTLAFNDCFLFEEMRGVPPNLKCLNALNCKSLTSFLHGSLLLNQKLHEDGGTEFLFRARIERIPEWFEHQSKGTSISFWFRKSIPSIALFFHSKTVGEGQISFGTCMRINGNIHPLRLLEGDHELQYLWMFEDFTYLVDVQLQDMGLESELNEAFLRNEWIHAEVVFYDAREDHVMKSKELFIESGTQLVLIESGIHVFKQKTSMEDIRFTNPYEGKRKLDEYLNSSLPHFVEEGYVKVNCDIAFSRKYNAAACGGILQDHLGSFLGGFTGQIGETQILHAELKAILLGVEFAWNKGYRKVIVESKSLSAIQLLRKEFPPDLSCLNLVREIQIFASSAGHVVWSHSSCEENGAASVLAENGLKLSWKDGLFSF